MLQNLLHNLLPQTVVMFAKFDLTKQLVFQEIELDSRNRVHLVNYGGRPYMMSAEISKMFPM